jgi:hypothetical protein
MKDPLSSDECHFLAVLIVHHPLWREKIFSELLLGFPLSDDFIR